MTRLSALLLVLTLFIGSVAHAQQSPLALTGAKVYPVSGPPLEHATVLIVDGRIKAVGANVTIPADARRVDLRGAVLIPGLVEARSALFLTDTNLAGAGAPDQDVLDAADLFDKEAGKILAQGVTTLYFSPGNRGSVGGVGAVVKLHSPTAGSGEMWAEPLKTRAALNLTLGLSANGRSTSLERLNSYEALRGLFRGAEQYQKAFTRYEADLQAYEKQQKQTPPKATTGAPPVGTAPPAGGPPAAAVPQKPVKPRSVPAQEVLVTALRREIPVRIEAHRPDDILNALRLADEFKLRLILESATESAGLAGEIARHHAAVVWGPMLPDGAPRLETIHATPETVALLARAGVPLALSTNSRSGLASRFLRENAALAIGYGLTPAQALKAITLGAAETLGVADRVGSIQAGKDADIVVLSGEPFSPAAQVRRVFVNGSEVYTAK